MTELIPLLIGAGILYNTSPLPNALAKQITSGIVLLLCLVVVLRGLV